MLLRFRCGDGDTVEFVRHQDLAGETGIVLNFFSEVEHTVFHIVFFLELTHKFVSDIDMAGRTGTGAAAIGINAGNHVLHSGFHDGNAVLGFDIAARAFMVDKDDFGHYGSCINSDCYVRACDDFASDYHGAMYSYNVTDETAMRALGAKIAGKLRIGDVIALHGDLGAGKTSLARGLIRALTDEDHIPSPTYTLVQTYEAPEFDIWHCDMYRLDSPEDCLELGLLDAFEEAVCLIEWPDKIGDYLPKTAKHIDITFDGDGRLVTLGGWENRFE